VNDLQYLADAEIEQMHEATLQLLAEIGISLTYPPALEMLLDNGAKQNGNRVLVPPGLVMESLAQCPSTITVVGHDREKAVTVGSGDVVFHNIGGAPNVFEPASKTRRAAVRDDNAKAARLLDVLPNVDAITSTFTPQDVDAEQMVFWEYLDLISNTSKPTLPPGTHYVHELRTITEMAQIAYPDVEIGQQAMAACPISPLIFPDEVVETVLEAARLGWAIGPLPAPIAGQTSPMSLVGSVVQQNAEVLASIVLVQLTNPGRSVVYHGRLGVMDPRSALSSGGNPETGMLSAATAQMAHYYHLPSNVYGLASSALTLSLQNGYERVVNALIPVLAGADSISGMGNVGDGIEAALAQMVIDDEIVSTVRRCRRGMEVNEDSLALPVIRAAVEGAGHFLAERHTVRYLDGGEVLIPRLARRDTWERWEASGKPDMVDDAEARVAQLLEKHEPVPLSETQLSALLEVIEGRKNDAPV
jgi:trimethylamine--corrinoid protein Co-methyltransferase